MKIERLTILNYKNIEQAEMTFSATINCFVGDNGAGKTNVLDALHYLSLCRSAMGMSDGQTIRHGEDFFMLSGEYATDAGSAQSVVCSFKRGAGKRVKRNAKEYERLSDHVGVVPVVMVSPSDTYLVNESPEERRVWLNRFISTADQTYLVALIGYNRILEERNKLLKQEGFGVQREVLDAYDAQMVKYGNTIYELRKSTIERLQPIVAEYYAIISGDREKVELEYRSELAETPFEDILLKERDRDEALGYTSAGIHRDDVVMTIGGYPLRKYGSQGQQKSFIIALKLAQCTLLAQNNGERPILLLDDLFDKLDTSRLGALINFVQSGKFGQIFISDCNPQRLTSILDSCQADYQLFKVDNGNIK